MKGARFTLDDLRQANGRTGGKCLFTAFLATLSTAERATVVTALADTSIQATAIHRVLREHGWKGSGQTIARHRRGGCAACGVPCP